MPKNQTYEFTSRMRVLEQAFPNLDPEAYEASKKKVTRLLEKMQALDVAPLLGLEP